MKITKTPDMIRGSIGSGNASSIGGVFIGPPGPGTGGGYGIVSSTSNTASWQPIVSTITAGGTLLQGPNVAFAAGSNVTISATSNTATIHATSTMLFNVEEYGAVADSSTDNRAAIVAADAAAAAVGGVVYFPASASSYYVRWSAVRHSLKPSAGVTWLGDGMFASVIEIDPASTISTSTSGQPVIEIGTTTAGRSEITLRDLGVIGNYSTLGASNKIIQGIAAQHDGDQTQHSDDITIERVRVYDVNLGIGCNKGNIAYPVATTRHERWSIRDCQAELTNNKAFELDQAQDSEIVDCTTINVPDGAQVYGFSARCRIVGNRIEYKDGGINVTEGVSDIDVSGNILNRIAGGGVGFVGGIVIRRDSYTQTGPTSSRVKIHHNIVSDAIASGIGIRFATYTANTGVAVFEDYEISSNIFRAELNYLYDEQFAAKSSATRLRVLDNWFSASVATSASWTATRTRLERNYITSAFTLNANDWDLRDNVFAAGAPTLTGTGYTLDDGYVRNVLISATSPSVGQVPTASSATVAAWATPVTVLDDLTDVTIAGLAADDDLRYNGSVWVNDARKWEAVTNGEDVLVWEDDDLVHEWST